MSRSEVYLSLVLPFPTPASNREAQESMDHALPYDRLVIMQAKRPYASLPSKPPQYLGDGDVKVKSVVLNRTANGEIAIRAALDGQELVVGANGGCFFESPELGIGEKFTVEKLADGSLAFLSGRTGHVLEIDGSGLPRCLDTIRRGWLLLEPHANPVDAVAVPVTQATELPCCHCVEQEAKERRQYIMRLVKLGTSLQDNDAILQRMYEWPKAVTIVPAEPAVPVGKERVLAPQTQKWQWK
ncbi:hypothetical protein BBJ28_00021928 [Nothophytophthora sp. Chile5]|nr:hypothetical protein BBJ28_00021928 [Nothophytophthora sp. Chile5]